MATNFQNRPPTQLCAPLRTGNASVRTPSLLAMKLRQVERAKNVTGEPRLTLGAPEIAGADTQQRCTAVDQGPQK